MPFVVTTNCASWAGVSTTFCFALKNASASGPPIRSFVAPFFGSLSSVRDPPPRDPVPRLPERQHHRRRDGRPRLGERGGELRRPSPAAGRPSSAASPDRPGRATRARRRSPRRPACGRARGRWWPGRPPASARAATIAASRWGRSTAFAIRASSAFSAAGRYDAVAATSLPKRRSFIRLEAAQRAEAVAFLARGGDRGGPVGAQTEVRGRDRERCDRRRRTPTGFASVTRARCWSVFVAWAADMPADVDAVDRGRPGRASTKSPRTRPRPRPRRPRAPPRQRATAA